MKNRFAQVASLYHFERLESNIIQDLLGVSDNYLTGIKKMLNFHFTTGDISALKKKTLN